MLLQLPTAQLELVHIEIGSPLLGWFREGRQRCPCVCSGFLLPYYQRRRFRHHDKHLAADLRKRWGILRK